MDLIDRLADQCGDRGLALNILRNRGHVEHGSEELTATGREREELGAEGRALDRRVQSTGGTSLDYNYNYETNRTTKR